MQEKQSKFRNSEDYTTAMNALNFENSKNQFLTEMAQKVQEPYLRHIAPNANQPQVVQAPQQQNQGVVREDPPEHEELQAGIQPQH